MSIPTPSFPVLLALSALALPLAAQSPIATRVPVFAPAKAAAVVAPSTAPLASLPGDDCATPIGLGSGFGTFAVDLTLATTSVVPSAACGPFGTNVMDHDLWFCWTSNVTGPVVVSTVGYANFDSMLAVYSGCACPTAAPLACNDDACGTLQSFVTFTATAGANYAIQVGTYPGANAGTGAFEIGPPSTLPVTCTYDDGVSENSIGLSAGGQIAWMHRFGAPLQWTNVMDVSTTYGSAALGGAAPPNGTPAEVVIWDDSDDDGDPATGLVLLGVYPTTVQNGDTDLFNTTAIQPPLPVFGLYFVGVSVTQAAGQYVAPIDSNAAACGIVPVSWVAGQPSGSLDYANLQAAGSVLTSLDALGIGGRWLLRAGCPPAPGASTCPGDGSLPTPCACGNNGAPGRGCASSFNAAGASLTANGTVSLDDVVLFGTGMNATGSCIFLKGNLNVQGGIPFGDGVRCASGTLIRMRTVPLVGGTASFPDATTTITLSTRGGTPVGSGLIANYTVYYRNAAAGFCPPETFNTSNGYQIAW